MVLVCNDPAFIYLKTRKTGSTSLEMLLEPFCASQGHVVTERTAAQVSNHGIIGARLTKRGVGFVFNHRLHRWRNHIAADKVRAYLGEEGWRSRIRIAAIRNPYDRLISYFYFKARYKKLLNAPFSDQRQAFLDFVAGPRWSDDREIVFSRGAFVIDHGVRLEHAAQDIAALAEKLGRPIPAEALPHTKKRSAGHERPTADYYDAAAIATVRRRLAWVFDHYDYPDDPVSEPILVPDEQVPS